jgi:hypothetical protein
MKGSAHILALFVALLACGCGNHPASETAGGGGGTPPAVVNGDFADGLGGWRAWGGKAIVHDLEDRKHLLSVSGSIRMDKDSGPTPMPAGAQQVISFKAGSAPGRLAVTAELRGHSKNAATPTYLAVRCLNSQLRDDATQKNGLLTGPSMNEIFGSTDWTTLAVNVDCPPQADTVVVDVYCYGDGTFDLANVKIEAGK